MKNESSLQATRILDVIGFKPTFEAKITPVNSVTHHLLQDTAVVKLEIYSHFFEL